MSWSRIYWPERDAVIIMESEMDIGSEVTVKSEIEEIDESDRGKELDPEKLAMVEKYGYLGDYYIFHEKYEKAMTFCNKAVNLAPCYGPCYIKRAKCNFKMLNWDAAFNDSKSAVYYDPENPESFYFLAMSYNVQHMFQEAKNAFHQAQVKAKAQKITLDDTLKRWIYSSHYWHSFRILPHIVQQARIIPQDENIFCIEKATRLLTEYMNSKCSKISALQLPEETIVLKKDKFIKAINKKIQRIRSFYRLKRKRKIEDYLCCKLTTKFLIHPVTAPSGYSYEKSAILHHLKNFGPFDPITLKPLTVDKLVRNEALEKEAEYYLKQNSWARRIYKFFSIV